jgi:anaerobic magnesium-protoporphyrin IX monomethyl ester cyclase
LNAFNSYENRGNTVGLRIVLLTPARRFICNRFGLGYQVPLGLVLIGGPLVDAGHTVWLVDNDAYGWSPDRLAHELAAFRPDCVMLGHTGSTAAHGTCLSTAAAIRRAFPSVKLVYGGVYPSYAAAETLRQCAAIDLVVRGEAEQTCLELVAALERGSSLDGVPGITWRPGGKDSVEIVENRAPPPIACLDAYRPGWELVDWPRYRLFGLGRTAGFQFSRGCTLTCTYCGQWLFWKKWRHRSPEGFVDELRTLRDLYGVRAVWLADESFAARQEVVARVLDHLVEANLGLSLNVNMTAADVVRDAERLPLYKRAGVDYVVMGVESLEDSVVKSVRKNNPYETSRAAVSALRRNGIVSLVNIIYGLEDETPRTLWQKFRKLLALDPDVLNAVYITPHQWTADGRGTDPGAVIQPDQSRWTYRNQVVAAPHLRPWQLFLGVKITEAVFHLRPGALLRLVRGDDPRVRRIRRHSLAVGARVCLAETVEFGWLCGRDVARATAFFVRRILERVRDTRSRT